MKLIPVVDLKQGLVVRAIKGDRAAYRPIESALCGSSDPVTVARILTAHCRSDALYVADLDALTGGAPQTAALAALLEALPGVTLWLDAAFATREAVRRVERALGPDAPRMMPVMASEAMAESTRLDALFTPRERSVLLSLDRRDGRRLDAAGCWDQPAAWPSRVIVMTLERVGADAGPDLATLHSVRQRAPDVGCIGAGGIRDAGDLAAAAAAGAQGWLVASALHDGRLPPVNSASGT